MDVRQSIHSAHAKTLDTQGLRNEFLVEEVFVADEYTMVYSHIDRIIVGGIMPITKTVSVGGEVGKQLGVSYFLERRELGVINIGAAGTFWLYTALNIAFVGITFWLIPETKNVTLEHIERKLMAGEKLRNIGV